MLLLSCYLLNTLVVFENTLKTAFEIPGVDAAINNAIKTSMMAYSIVVTPFCRSLRPPFVSIISVSMVSFPLQVEVAIGSILEPINFFSKAILLRGGPNGNRPKVIRL